MGKNKSFQTVLLEHTGFQGKVRVWQNDTAKKGWVELKWYTPFGKLRMAKKEYFTLKTSDELRELFQETIALIESKEWLEEQENKYLQQIEKEIAVNEEKKRMVLQLKAKEKVL